MAGKPSGKPPKGGGRGGSRKDRPVKSKPCVFCQEGVTYVDYKDYNMLRRFISERGKIRARRVTGLCPQHQREAATAIKRAREMALLPYVAGKGSGHN
ncbi:30S ribosomal protein S18 [Rubrobacter aplysinae]|uniref:30S ribosomal protein S18 n=1 Tax=Rubrobacter aplysinae TaxID=909625 RepID=UPI000A06DC7D|nr:30S ribosomal protein S18 [Rubrobacter aplysinae]